MRIYMDTARQGQACPAAMQVECEFARLAFEDPYLCSLPFLQHGASVWPEQLQREFPELSCWNGSHPLHEQMALALGTQDADRVFVASQSARLVRTACRLMFRQCRRVLTTDLNWPAWQQIANEEAQKHHGRIHIAELKDLAIRGNASPQELNEVLQSQFLHHDCDGLFIPAVSSLGIRLAVAPLLRQLRNHRLVRFAIVDGAQALGHIPVSDIIDSCDVFIAGCHKWLQAHLPLGVALTGNGLTTEQFASLAMNSDTSSDCHDPLLRFSQELRMERLQKYSETVNVLPLLTANSTLRAASKALNTITDSLTVRQTNRQNVANLLQDSPWCPMASTSMDCGILLVEPRQTERWNPEAITAAMYHHGISLSVYPDRTLRLSMPSQILTESQLQFLRNSFISVSQQML